MHFLLPLLTQFVNALESIATHRDESLTGSSSRKMKKYFIEIEPDVEEHTQVSDRWSPPPSQQSSFVIYTCSQLDGWNG